MSGLTIQSSHTVNQLNEELYSEFLGNVRSFLDKFFSIRHVTVLIGQDRLQKQTKEMAAESFNLSGGDWLTIKNKRATVVEIRFPRSNVFGITKAFIEAGCTATFRVDESIEKTPGLVAEPDKETPQLIIIGPPIEQDRK